MAVPITKQPEPPIAPEIIASSIVEISRAMQVINKTRLSRKALVVLIQDQSHLPKKTIEIVLNNLTDLEKDWLKPA